MNDSLRYHVGYSVRQVKRCRFSHVGREPSRGSSLTSLRGNADAESHDWRHEARVLRIRTIDFELIDEYEYGRVSGMIGISVAETMLDCRLPMSDSSRCFRHENRQGYSRVVLSIMGKAHGRTNAISKFFQYDVSACVQPVAEMYRMASSRAIIFWRFYKWQVFVSHALRT